MANKWYHKHGQSLTFLGLYGVPAALNAPDDNVFTGNNVVYVDPSNPNSSDTASNRGCANVPYTTLTTAIAEKTTIILFILGKGTYSGVLTPSSYNTKMFLSDVFANAIITFELYNNGFYNCVIQSISIKAGGGGAQYIRFNNCIMDANIQFLGKKSLVTKITTYISGVSIYTNNVFICCALTDAVAYSYSLLYNCVRTVTNATFLYNQVFWLGTINYNALTADLNDICVRIDANTITEDQGIAEVETALGLAANILKNNCFRLLNPHFINVAKGNFNIDFLNYDCNDILSLRDAWIWIINRGIKCEYPAEFVGGSGFGYSADVNDGFGGALYSRNIDASGNITNAAYDTVLVSKKFVLPSPYLVENINFFDKLISSAFSLNATKNDGTDSPNLYTFYLIGVASGNLEDEFNNSSYTFSYTGGVLTCDFPIFVFNSSTQLNKVGNVILGEWDNGTFDLDEARNIFKAGVIEFRLIAVKKGV